MSTPRQDAIALLLDFVDYDFLVHDNLFEWLQEERDDDGYDSQHAEGVRDECLGIIQELRTHLRGLETD